MSRSTKRRNVKRIIAALDRASWSVHGREERVLDIVADALLGGDDHFDIVLYQGERKIRPTWTDEAIRAVILAHALNAPKPVLAWMAHVADEQVKWCDWWDAEGWFESQGFVPLPERAA